MGGGELVENIPSKTVKLEVYNRAAGDAIGSRGGALQVDAVQADFLFDNHIAFKFVNAIGITDIIPGGNLAGRQEVRLLQSTGIGIDFRRIGLVVRVKLCGQGGVNHLEDQGALAAKERVYPLGIGSAGNLDQNLIAALQPDDRLADAELVDALLENLDILSDGFGNLGRGGRAALLRLVTCRISFQEDAHTTTQVQTKL